VNISNLDRIDEQIFIETSGSVSAPERKLIKDYVRTITLNEYDDGHIISPDWQDMDNDTFIFTVKNAIAIVGAKPGEVPELDERGLPCNEEHVGWE